jgi:rhodanese-related sulfurtransferase
MNMATTTFNHIDRAELKEKLDRQGGFYLWDTRSPEFFNNEVLPGAKWVPVSAIEKTLKEKGIKPQDEIVVYCASTSCPASKMAAEQLTKLGYTNVSAYEGGLADWKEGGLPTVQSAN